MMRPALALPFSALRFHATAALQEAKKLHASENGSPFDNDPVNWADLSVHTVEFWESDTGAVGWRVYVSEAGAHAHKLAEFVHEYLTAHGLYGVEVVTEW